MENDGLISDLVPGESVSVAGILRGRVKYNTPMITLKLLPLCKIFVHAKFMIACVTFMHLN